MNTYAHNCEQARFFRSRMHRNCGDTRLDAGGQEGACGSGDSENLSTLGAALRGARTMQILCALRPESVALARAFSGSRRQIDRHKGETGLALRGDFKAHNVLVPLGAGLQLEAVIPRMVSIVLP